MLASCFSAVVTAKVEGKHLKISGDNCYFHHAVLSQTLGWSTFFFFSLFSCSLRHSRARQIDFMDETRWHQMPHDWFQGMACTLPFPGKVRAAHVFSFSSSNNPSDLQSFMQVKEESTTKNRNTETCLMQILKKQLLICAHANFALYLSPSLSSPSPSQGLLWNQSICSGCVLCLKAIPIKSSLIRPALSEQNQSRAK